MTIYLRTIVLHTVRPSLVTHRHSFARTSSHAYAHEKNFLQTVSKDRNRRFVPGALRAVAYDGNGTVIADTWRNTTGAPARLHIRYVAI